MGLLLKTHDHFRVGIQAPQKAEFIKYVNMVRRRFLVLNSNGRTRRQLALVGYFRRYRRLPAAAAAVMQHHLRRCGGGALAALRRLRHIPSAAAASPPAAWRCPCPPPRLYSTAGEHTSPALLSNSCTLLPSFNFEFARATMSAVCITSGFAPFSVAFLVAFELPLEEQSTLEISI